MAFKRDLFSKDSSRISLLDRIKTVGQSLRDVKPADVAFMAANVAVGVAAKTLVVGSLAAVGVTASTILGGAAVAIAGGAAVGVARVALSHALKRNEGPLFSRENLKKVALGSAISAATFGVLSGADALATHTDIGAKAAEKLTSAFNGVKGWLFGAKAASVAVAPVATPAVANDLPEHCEILKKSNGVVEGFKIDVGPSHPDFSKINTDCENKWGQAIRAERGLADVEAPQSVATAQAVVEAKPHSSHKAGHGLKKVMKAIVAAKADVPAVPANDLASQEIKEVMKVTSQAEVNDVYAAERMSATIADTTGVAPAEGTSVQDMAAQIHPDNPETYLKAIQQQAPQLDKEHVAAVVKTHVPKDYSAPVSFNSDYTILKPEMGSQDVVIIRDVNSDEPKKGIRVLWKAVTRALGGQAESPSTKDFLKTYGPGEVEGMVKESMEAYQQTQPLPQAALQ